MKRRTLLKGVACGTVMGFAGCLNQGDVGAGGRNNTDSANTDNSSGEADDNGDRTTDNNGTETGRDGETTDSDGTPRPSKQKSTLINHSFEIISSGCGTNNGEINASFTDHTVRVTGSIRGKNSCYTAELKNVTCEQGTLTATVRSFETKSSGMCAMCLTNIKYESTYTFDGGLPERVVVTHNDKQVLNTTR